MFENKKKKWYGSYSRIGKSSAENFYQIIHKDDILNRDYKKIKGYLKKIKPDLDYLDDNINLNKIFNTKYSIIKSISSSPNKKINNKKMREKYNLKYHNISHLEIMKKNRDIYIEPTCTKYNPKYDIIFQRLVTGPKWKKILGRTCPIRNMTSSECFLNNKNISIENKSKENCNNNNFNKKEKNNKDKKKKSSAKKQKEYKRFCIIDNGESKCLVDMNKTTQRGDLFNIRVRTEKAFNKKENNNNNKNNMININSNSEEKKMIDNKNNYFLTKDNKKNKTNIMSNKYTKIKNLKKLLLKNINTNRNYKLLRTSNLFPLKENKSPDFSKIISREKLQKIAEKSKNTFISLVSPNYSQVSERPISMVLYEKSKINKKRRNFTGIDSNLNFDIDKVINKVNNHRIYKPRNFDNMISRTYNEANPLPNYMQGIYNRTAVDSFNEKTLKINEYSNGKFLTPTNTFMPKTSHNKIINLSLLKCCDIENKNKDDYNEIYTDKLIKQINYRNNNNDNLILEGALNKFDKITFKSIEKNKDMNRTVFKKLMTDEEYFKNKYINKEK